MKKTKRTVIAIVMTIVMLLSMCLSVYADHSSSWKYSDKYTNIGARTYTYVQNYGIETDVYVNRAGYTYDMFALTALSYESNGTYKYYEYSSDLADNYGALDEDEIRDITTIRSHSSMITHPSGETLCHSCGGSIATVTNYVPHEETGRYELDWIQTYSEEIHSMNHNSSNCRVCADFP